MDVIPHSPAACASGRRKVAFRSFIVLHPFEQFLHGIARVKEYPYVTFRFGKGEGAFQRF